jgi:ADP-ribosylglycohydrolase
LLGCVFGGALGDALGAHVEFMPWETIKHRFGDAGITQLEPTNGTPGTVTDDTQMTVFSIEAAIRWSVAERAGMPAPFIDASWQAYLRWLVTQDSYVRPTAPLDGWVLSLPWLHHLRAPGNTNLSALRGGVMGRLDRPINGSRGCGAVMRSAPLGFFARDVTDAFDRGLHSGVVTHSDAGGYLPSAILSAAIFLISHDVPVADALAAGAELAAPYDDSARTLDCLERGIALGQRGLPTPSDLHGIGGGWMGHEALPIAVACALSGAPMVDVLCAAANHDGDSDSTASIAGQLVGARDGTRDIPPSWLGVLEGRTDLEQLCDDFIAEFSVEPPEVMTGSPWWLRYPGVVAV